MHLSRIACRRRHHSFLYYSYAVLGILWTISVVTCIEYERVSRKLLSSPEPDLDGKFSNEDLRQLLTLLEGKMKNNNEPSTTTRTERASPPEHKTIPPELMRVHTPTTAPTSTASTPSKVTTRRFYRRLRRKTTTTPATTTSTESPLTTSSTVRSNNAEVESARALSNGASPGDFLQQLTLLNGILGALNSSAAPPTAPPPYIPLPSSENDNANANEGTGTSVPDILAILTGAKNMVGEASSKSETIVPPPPPPPPSPQPSPTSIGQQVDDPAAALALLNLFGSSNANTNSQPKDSSENSNAAALLNLVSQQSQPQQTQPSSASISDSDTTAALTKLLLQSAASNSGAGQPIQGNSILHPQQQPQSAEASANQLTNLLGLLGTLGAAQQPQSNSINNLFNLGGDQVAQAQTPNHLATLFGAQQQQQHQQQNQAQNLLSLLGGNQGNQGLNLASLLGGQNGNQNAIPGLGLLSTVSSLGSSLLGSVSSIFSGGRDGTKRVRGKGVDTRVGLGYRLGNIGDAQVVWDIGPQLFTEPLRNEMRPFTKKRESGAPSATAASHYFQPSSTTAAEKEVQQIEAKRRMVQAAIQDHYRGDHFASVYPKQTKRRTYDYPSHYTKPPTPTTSYSHASAKSKSSSSFFSLPFADHFKGFWSGLTSGIMGNEDNSADSSSSSSHYYNFDDVRSDFSANLIKRSSPDYVDYESRAYHPRRLDDDKLDDPTHSTLTDYERMLLQYGKDIGVANTQHGVIEDEEPQQSESSIFSRWFKNPLSSLSSSLSSTPTSRNKPSASEWDSMSSGSNEYAARLPAQQPHQKSVKKTFRQPTLPSSLSHFNLDASFNRRNDAHGHPRRTPNHRPQKRRSHNPFRNFITSLKNTAGLGGGQRPRPQPQQHQQQTGGFGRRHFKRPSSGNPKLQHFTNMNKDLMMADANDDFVHTAGRESVPAFNDGYEQPLTYKYADEFPDVSLTSSETTRKRLRPSAATLSGPLSSKTRNSQLRAALSQREKIIEPALLYDHLEIQETPMVETEADESFHNRNKVVLNPTLREIEKQKILGTPVPSISSTPMAKVKTVVTPSLATMQKIQRLRLNKLRASLNNSTAHSTGKKKIIVKVKGNSNHKKVIPMEQHSETHSESTTALPSVLSTISSIFSGTSKPKLRIGNLIHNASSLLPSISAIRILPRKKKKDNKTKLTMMNGKPTIIGPPDDEDEDELEAESSEHEPLVQVGHDMDFSELQQIFSPKNNGTKRKRFRIRVKESVLKGEKADKEKQDSKERKDSDEEEDDENLRDIFVDIDSGEVSVLKPVASLVSFAPKKEEQSEEEEIDYYEDDDGDGVADMDMKRKEHIFDAIQQQLVKSFEKMKKAQLRAEQKKRRKQELAEKGMDESMDVVTKYFDLMKNNDAEEESKPKPVVLKNPGGLSLDKKR